ncbi:aldehyde dehydrogenase family protein [Mycobacterium intracellulare]|uniref:aldehyde dehydrogenase family protein n=1 Tax=Mycobacterium intracellulare TaxID=1767 RepID=UPI00044A2EA1|nr:aldehyde dehydrogenase family protein [Mycobacterium intracellulare]ETZ39912.1 aldehyde dehydrogenase family protein [Mycobacterium intracellulare MIN_061107_1834]UEB24808.1 aldehyde dehydrogenase family protein [Mycobacterium intracellulare]BCO60182.1 aldehyde dehydrogenase [Mycobacterium intracellulare]BCO70799.1 aldehyde dehydrogenase [Mycobacterium intracellulare]BCO76351.1 aldehyde dehydrogenase [Mycobacterium intracellulare]
MSGEHYVMTIDGKPVCGTDLLPVDNPATGDIVGYAPDATAGQLDDAFTAALRALPGWSADADGRDAAMQAAANEISGAVEELADLVTSEQGKPLAEARAEVLATLAAFRYFAGQRLEPTVLADGASTRVVVRRRPVGVVAAITPWNSPVMVAGAMKIAPAIAAGNTIILKPSPFTPLSTLRLGQLLAVALPPGVVNIVSGGSDVGRSMTTHPVPRLITFTGSPATGRLVFAAAASDFKRTVLELGGNDPAIVLDDAAIPEIAEALFWGAFGNAGQTCVAIKRIYAPAQLYGDLVDALAAVATSVWLGDGHDPKTHMGPLTVEAQRRHVADLVDDARARGGRVVTGGEAISGPGNFYRPTVVASVADGFRLVDEEQFGPALPVVCYRDIDDVLTSVNASPYGLGGSVWSSDPERARRIADRIEAGTTWINTHRGSLFPLQPTAGLRSSGMGAELGSWGLECFTDLTVRHAAPATTARRVGMIIDKE